MQKALRSTMRKYFVISKESAPAIGSDLNIFCCNQLEVVFAYQHIDCFSTRKKMIKQVTTKSTTYFDHSICRIPSLRGKSLLVRRYRYVIFFISTHFFKCRCVELHTYVYFKILFFLGRYQIIFQKETSQWGNSNKNKNKSKHVSKFGRKSSALHY